jgi:hypothetical protein
MNSRLDPQAAEWSELDRLPDGTAAPGWNPRFHPEIWDSFSLSS